ncbi:MAG: CRISPR-associated protein Cas4 [Anaerolineae bacterium]|nr:CRISPR-associated protein Cas4 [Anaerolineae bacterium]
MNGALIVGMALLLMSMLILWGSNQLRRRTGLPAGRVIYTDTRAWQECPKPLYASWVNLAGKPDYLVKQLHYVIPVEVKTSRAPAEPYRSHVLQLAAYCLLVEETYGRRPPYGLIHYSDRTFSIRYTKALEDELLDTIEWMREDYVSADVSRSHNDPLRCQHCGFTEYCDQQLK